MNGISPLSRIEQYKSSHRKKSKREANGLMKLLRELGCLPQIIGETYEVYDKEGQLQYTIRRRPMTSTQLNELLKSIGPSLQEDHEFEMKKWQAVFGGKGRGR